MEGIECKFTARPYQYSSSADMNGWTFISFPKDLSLEIRNNFKCLERAGDERK